MSWEDGLVFAGLDLPDRPDNRGADELAATRAFVEELGKVPRSAKQLRQWAQDRKRSIRMPLRAALDAAVAEIQSEQAAKGQPALTIAEPGDHRAATRPAATPTNGRPARTREWETPEIILGLARAIRILGPGRQLTQRKLKESRRSIPAAASLHGHP